MSEETNNPVYKLKTDKCQLTCSLDRFLNDKVSLSHGSVATRLRCDGIFNDQFISQSLLSLPVKEF